MNETIIFMGTPDFSVPVLRALHENHGVSMVISQPDKPVGRKRILTPPPVAAAAEGMGIPLFQPERIKDFGAVDKIREMNPDLIITAAYGQILPKELLDIPRLGAVNVHASLLPRHRGGAPIHRAILEGDRESGVSIMYMAEGLDSGDVISQSAVQITDDDNTGTLHDRLSTIGAKLLLETLPSILDGTNDRAPQDPAEVTVSPNIQKEDERLDWTRDARAVFNHIRGLSPWPGAYTMLDGKRLKIYGALKPAGSTSEMPGTITGITERGFTVACGDGRAVEVTEVQLSGKKKSPAHHFAAGRQDLTGTVMGQVD
ncbi:methionyl-tRNA formyltransferase [Salinicoccus carnicancri]|uniref:methionyl-tRNA formyltransferase n=1 Tax=Salinicoccus carnicancri TaxID=558170 RepID=UPI000307AFEC|nr:methionyl-tRNA formyltransferase [Salinicoccus carnicancri]